RYRTATFKISHRKLNKLANQIGGKPIDSAILQMQFSAKRAASRIKSLLALGRNQAADRGMRTERMVVAEAWVNKGPKLMRMDIRGRGRFGIKHHPSARMHIVLKEGKTRAEKKEEALRKRIGLVRSAGWYREDVPIRNARPYYVW
ncbi:ribosomal protein L22, partial [Calocera cornea HHB12733]